MSFGAATGPADVLGLVAAVADADAHVVGGDDDLARPLVVEHPQPAVRVRARARARARARLERPLVDEDPPQLRLAVREEADDELVLDGDVLVVELGEQLLIDVVADAHHRELEEAGHRRRQDVDGPVRALHVEEDRARGQPVQDGARFGQAHPPGPGRLPGRERSDRELRHEPCLALAEEQLEDPVEQLGRRRALREAVQAVGQLPVGAAGRGVGHRTSPSGSSTATFGTAGAAAKGDSDGSWPAVGHQVTRPCRSDGHRALGTAECGRGTTPGPPALPGRTPQP